MASELTVDDSADKEEPGVEREVVYRPPNTEDDPCTVGVPIVSGRPEDVVEPDSGELVAGEALEAEALDRENATGDDPASNNVPAVDEFDGNTMDEGCLISVGENEEDVDACPTFDATDLVRRLTKFEKLDTKVDPAKDAPAMAKVP